MKKMAFYLFICLILIISVVHVNAVDNYYDFDRVFKETTIEEIYFYNILSEQATLNEHVDELTNMDLIRSLYRIELLSEYHWENTQEIELSQKTEDPILFWMYTSLNLSDEFLENFDANAPLTKQSLSVFLYSYAQHLDINIVKDFKDIDYQSKTYESIPNYAKKAAAWAVKKQFVSLTKDIVTDGKFLLAEKSESIAQEEAFTPIKVKTILDTKATINKEQLEEVLIKYLNYLAAAKTYGEDIVAFARTQLGEDYVWGGYKPSTGFDCSGFVFWVFQQSGYKLAGRRNGANSLSTRYGNDIMKYCLDDNGKIDWDKVPAGSVIGIDWDHDGSCDHIGIWTGESSLIHASGGPDKQYARNGYMIEEAFLGEGDGKKTSRDNKFDYYIRSVVEIRDYRPLRPTV